MGVRLRVTASQVSFSKCIGEPGHTKPHAAALRHRAYAEVLILVALLSTLIEGLPTPRARGNLTFQPWSLQPVRCRK